MKNLLYLNLLDRPERLFSECFDGRAGRTSEPLWRYGHARTRRIWSPEIVNYNSGVIIQSNLQAVLWSIFLYYDTSHAMVNFTVIMILVVLWSILLSALYYETSHAMVNFTATTIL